MPGKRSDPRKLAEERAKIVRDMEERKNVPQSERMFPNLLEQGKRLILEKVEGRRRRRQRKPTIAQAGFEPGDNTI